MGKFRCCRRNEDGGIGNVEKDTDAMLVGRANERGTWAELFVRPVDARHRTARSKLRPPHSGSKLPQSTVHDAHRQPT
jgi:hypothetical protein